MTTMVLARRRDAGIREDELMDPFMRHPTPDEWEPDDAELGWADDDSVPINIHGETEEETD